METLLDWMDKSGSDPDLVECLEQYMLSNGERLMGEIIRHFPKLRQFALQHDILGWDNFMEGLICRELFSLQADYLHHTGPRLTIQ
jgi:hypothetical protein